MTRKNIKIRKPPILFGETQAILGRIAKKVEAPFIAYWNSPNGSVCHNDVVGFHQVLQAVGRTNALVLFIKSDGGTGTASLRIVHLLRQFARRLVVLAPMNCVSAATMIALGADEIRMGPLAYLSAVDTSLTHDLSPVDKDNERVSVSQNELERILRLWRKEGQGPEAHPLKSIFQYIHPLVMGAVDRASSLSIRLCKEILSYHLRDGRRADRIARTLNEDYPAHAYPITRQEARRIGLNVQALDPDLNELLIELNEAYSEMGQKATTDYDERNYHDNEVLNILETKELMVFYQTDQDWHYRTEERRWVSMNDKSGWRKVERKGRRVLHSVFHLR